MWRVIRSSLRAHILRLVTTSIAVILGVGFTAGTLTLKDGIGATFDSLFDQIGEGIDVVVRGRSQFSGPFIGEQRPDLPAAYVDQVAAVPGVAAAAGVVADRAQFVDPDGQPIGSSFGAPPLGFNWIDDPVLNAWEIFEGRPPESLGEVVMDRGTAREHGFEVGDEVEVIVVGVPRDFELVGTARFGSLDSAAGASTALFETSAMQEMFERGDTFDEIDVAGDGSATQDELASRVAAAVPPDVEVVTGAAVIEETKSAVGEALDSIGTILLVIGFVALFVGSYTIANTFSIIVAQRGRELALLRAVGARRSQVVTAVVTEAVAVGLVGGLLGLLLGIGLAALLQMLLTDLAFGAAGEGVVVTPLTIVLSLAVGVIVTVVSALWPAWRASRVPPVAALRDVAIDRAAFSRIRIGIGVVVTGGAVAMLLVGLFADVDYALQSVGAGVGFTFIGVTILGPALARPAARVLGAPLQLLRGTTGQIARRNAMRNPTRTASTASALMIGVALITLLSVFLASLETEIDTTVGEVFLGDVVIDTGAGFGLTGVSPELTAEVVALPEVGAATGVRFGIAQVAGRAGLVVAIDPTQVDEILDLGVIDGDLAAIGPGGIAVSEEFARDSRLGVGDIVPAQFLTGGIQVLTVAAVYTERDRFGDLLISTEGYDSWFPTSVDSFVYIVGAEGVDPDDVERAVSEVAAAYPNARVQDRAEFIEDQSGFLQPILVLFTALLSFAVVIALFGITNTLALSVLERTREIGLLRAVGMSRSQVRSSVRWESVIISLFGTGLGLVIGVFFARVLIYALADEGFTSFTLPVGRLVLTGIVAAVAGVVTGLWPARRASRIDILEAIGAE